MTKAAFWTKAQSLVLFPLKTLQPKFPCHYALVLTVNRVKSYLAKKALETCDKVTFSSNNFLVVANSLIPRET